MIEIQERCSGFHSKPTALVEILAIWRDPTHISRSKNYSIITMLASITAKAACLLAMVYSTMAKSLPQSLGLPSDQEWTSLTERVEFLPASDEGLPQLRHAQRRFLSYYSENFVDGQETEYNEYAQAWRFLGMYVDCYDNDAAAEEGRRRRLEDGADDGQQDEGNDYQDAEEEQQQDEEQDQAAEEEVAEEGTRALHLFSLSLYDRSWSMKRLPVIDQVIRLSNLSLSILQKMMAVCVHDAFSGQL